MNRIARSLADKIVSWTDQDVDNLSGSLELTILGGICNVRSAMQLTVLPRQDYITH